MGAWINFSGVHEGGDFVTDEAVGANVVHAKECGGAVTE